MIAKGGREHSDDPKLNDFEAVCDRCALLMQIEPSRLASRLVRLNLSFSHSFDISDLLNQTYTLVPRYISSVSQFQSTDTTTREVVSVHCTLSGYQKNGKLWREHQSISICTLYLLGDPPGVHQDPR
jgi:hypothetical protein